MVRVPGRLVDSTMQQEPIHARYVDVRRDIRNADVLLFRRRNRITKAIMVAGRSRYTHAAMAGWWKDRLMCVEMTSGGGRAQLLSNIVQRWPGCVDVYSVIARPPRFAPWRALDVMIEITGRPYGWFNLFRASALHMPFVRFLVRPDEDDTSSSTWPPFCSHAVSKALRAGGGDPVPNLADRHTEPGDLARSAMLKYQFTLI
jgi:hypothetical protein